MSIVPWKCWLNGNQATTYVTLYVDASYATLFRIQRHYWCNERRKIKIRGPGRSSPVSASLLALLAAGHTIFLEAVLGWLVFAVGTTCRRCFQNLAALRDELDPSSHFQINLVFIYSLIGLWGAFYFYSIFRLLLAFLISMDLLPPLELFFQFPISSEKLQLKLKRQYLAKLLSTLLLEIPLGPHSCIHKWVGYVLLCLELKVC